MFGGIAASMNGHVFAGLFGRSTMLLLSEADSAEALRLPGATLFDPMGNGRVRSDKVMLPEKMMRDPAALRGWIARAFKAAALLPPKGAKPAKKTAKTAVKKTAKAAVKKTAKTAVKQSPAKTHR